MTAPLTYAPKPFNVRTHGGSLMSTLTKRLLIAAAILGAIASQALPADRTFETKTAPKKYTFVFEVQYLALVTPIGATTPLSMVEYEVRVEHEPGGVMTEEAADARALTISRDGLAFGLETDRRVVPPHLIQSVRMYTMATANR